MNDAIKNIVASVASLLPLSFLKAGRKYPPVLPFYHLIRSSPPQYINSYAVHTEEEFVRELDFLLKHFTPVGLDEIIHAPDNTKMHLTFDDGLKECSTLIAPVLKRKGIPATFFVSPDFVANKSTFHRFKRAILESEGVLKPGGKRFFIHEAARLDELAANHNIDFSVFEPYMDFDEISDLYRQGFTIGGHSMNHPEMWLLNEDEQLTQIVDSMKWVNANFDQKIRAFSFPFTDDGLKHSLFEKIKQSGELDVTFGTAGLKFDETPFHFQRIPIERSKKWTAEKVIHFEFLYFHLRKLFSANRVTR